MTDNYKEIIEIRKIIEDELYIEEELYDDITIEIIGKGTGVKGDIGLHGYIVVIDNINCKEWRKLKKIQSRITNNIPNVSRVLYRI